MLHLKEENMESLSVFGHIGQGQDHNTKPLRPSYGWALSRVLYTSLSCSEHLGPVTPGLCISVCTWCQSEACDPDTVVGGPSALGIDLFASVKLMLFCDRQLAGSFCPQLSRTPREEEWVVRFLFFVFFLPLVSITDKTYGRTFRMWDHEDDMIVYSVWECLGRVDQ